MIRAIAVGGDVVNIRGSTNNILPKVQRNKAQRLFQPLKAQFKIGILIFLFSEA